MNKNVKILFILIIAIIVIIFVFNIKSNLTGLYTEPTYASKEEVESYIQKKLGKEWKIIGEAKEIYRATERTEKSRVSKAYEYILYRESNNDYIYAYAISRYDKEYYFLQSGGDPHNTGYYKKDIICNYLRDIVDCHKDEITKIANEYGLNIDYYKPISEQCDILEIPHTEISIEVNNELEWEKAKQYIKLLVENVLKIECINSTEYYVYPLFMIKFNYEPLSTIVDLKLVLSHGNEKYSSLSEKLNNLQEYVMKVKDSNWGKKQKSFSY